jgi:hypothetical protein
LIWAAAGGHADCVSRLLSGRATFQQPGGASVPLGDAGCRDEDGT